MASATDEQPAEARCALPRHYADVLEQLQVPYLKEEETVAFLQTHGRLLFLVRGPPACRKKVVQHEIERLYPGSQAYYAHKFFEGDVIPEWNSDMRRQGHELCRKKIDEFMAQNVPFIINKDTNVQVWEVNGFLEMAARHSYTVILVNMPHHFIITAETLVEAATKYMKPYQLVKMHLSRRLREWEEVHPFATGWSPRLRDAAELLNRFCQIREALQKAGSGMVPKDAVTTMATPFALARISLFGRTKVDKDYCESQTVRKACGQKDTLTVFGYGVTEGFVYAMVTLSEAQMFLTKGPDGGGNGSNAADKRDDLPELCAATLSIDDDWKEVRTEIDLSKFMGEDAGHNLTIRADCKTSLSDLDPSSITIIPLGACEKTDFSYCRAVGSPWELLSSKLRSWSASAKLSGHLTRIAGIDVFGSLEAAGDACLLIDHGRDRCCLHWIVLSAQDRAK